MLFAIEFIQRQHIALCQRRQFAALLFIGIVYVFHIDTDEAGEDQSLTGSAEQSGIAAQANIQTDRVETRRRHLACKCALPNHFVKTCLINTQMTTYAVWSARN